MDCEYFDMWSRSEDHTLTYITLKCYYSYSEYFSTMSCSSQLKKDVKGKALTYKGGFHHFSLDYIIA